MNSRERLLTALNHREPDRIPLDLGSTQVTGIHVVAYRNLRAHLGLPPVEPRLCDVIQQLALPDDDVIEQLGVDVRGLFPLNSHNWNVTDVDVGDAWEYADEWGITHRRIKPDGLYYSAVKHPLAGDVSVQDVQAHAWPDTGDPQRIAGLGEQALAYRAQGKAVMIKGVLAGIFEMAQRMRGMEACLMDMASNEALAGALLDKMTELKLAFWEMALPRLAGAVDVISEADDYGTQASQLISPRMFRKLIKPRLQVLFQRIKQLAPGARLFFHSCGNVRPLLPDLIEIGVDILNPVQVSAKGMDDTAALKRRFGRELTFWGGACDSQRILPFGTLQEIRAETRRRIADLAPGGGYVFAPIHNLQDDVSGEKALMLYRTALEQGRYPIGAG